jgi:hypothetical protein
MLTRILVIRPQTQTTRRRDTRGALKAALVGLEYRAARADWPRAPDVGRARPMTRLITWDGLSPAQPCKQLRPGGRRRRGAIRGANWPTRMRNSGTRERFLATNHASRQLM